MPLSTAAQFGLAGISSATDLIGGLFGRSGQRDANRRSIELAREQMAFQERMSNTAYQRATKDLEAAGLNRILALGKPASSPAGQTARVENEQAPIQAALKGTVAQAANTAANTALQLAQAEKVKKEAEILAPKSTIWGALGKVAEKALKALEDRMPEAADLAEEKIGEFMSGTPVPEAIPKPKNTLEGQQGEVNKRIIRRALAYYMTVLEADKNKQLSKEDLNKVWRTSQERALSEWNRAVKNNTWRDWEK